MLIKKHIQEKFSYINVKEILNVVGNYRGKVNDLRITIHYSYYYLCSDLSRISIKDSIALTNTDPRYYIIAIFRILMRNDLIKVSGVEIRSYTGYTSCGGRLIFNKSYKETC